PPPRLYKLHNGFSFHTGTTAAPMIPQGSLLIGDAGYPGNVNILLPYPSVVNPKNEWFNYIQSATRIVVEQAFGHLKNQFRLLLTAQIATHRRAKRNTFACMILHNLLNLCRSLYIPA
ncbi:hypothetical protein VP01_5943g2, partial [Puccinia sorghi]